MAMDWTVEALNDIMNAELDEPADMRAHFDYVSQLTEEFGLPV